MRSDRDAGSIRWKNRFWLLPLVVWPVAVASAQSPQDKGRQFPAIANTELRIAHSQNGIDFVDSGSVLLRGASGADAIFWGDQIIVVFDYAGTNNPNSETRMGTTRSTDFGERWSPLSPLDLFQGNNRIRGGRHPSLVTNGDKVLSMYYTVPRKRALSSRNSPTHEAWVVTAQSRDGVRFRVARGAALRLRSEHELHPVVYQGANSIHLITDSLARIEPSPDENSTGATLYTESPRGGRLTKKGTIRIPGVRFVGDVVRTDIGLRAYVSSERGIISLTSIDGATWKKDDGLRIEGGWDPAVLKLGTEAYLMVYSARLTTGPSDTAPLVAAPNESAFFDEFEEVKYGPVEFPPMADFDENFDYLAWFVEHMMLDPEDNAYEAYQDVVAMLNGDEAPLLSGPLIDVDFEGPALPWDPADFPEWEASFQATQDLLERYREATLHEGYGRPILMSDMEGTLEEDLLVGLMLPQLSQHRTAWKLLVSQAWREDEGQVSGEQMNQNFETVLRGAAHMQTGPTLIDNLIAVAGRSMVERESLRALGQGVFDASQTEAAFDMLMEFDSADTNFGNLVAGEYAMFMDILQYSYPVSPDTLEPTFSRERTEGSGLLYVDESESSQLAEADPNLLAEKVHDYFQGARTLYGSAYWETSDKQASQYEDEQVEASPLAKHFMGSLARAHELNRRQQTMANGTKLAFAINIFRDKTGRWPSSLDELPPAHRDRIRIDPYTGTDFAYHLTPNGPMLYSRSANGTDDGGVHSRRWGDIREEGASDDYVFWPPQVNR